MAEKLLTGASFKAPDWKGNTAARVVAPMASILTAEPAAAATIAAAAPAAAEPMETTPADILEHAATQPVSDAAQGFTAAAVPAAAAEPAAAPMADAAAQPAAADSDTSMGSAQISDDEEVQQAPPAARQQPAGRAVIRQPGWVAAVAQPEAQQSQAMLPAPLLPEVALQRTHLNDMPDDLLQRIFSLLPFRKRCGRQSDSPTLEPWP